MKINEICSWSAAFWNSFKGEDNRHWRKQQHNLTWCDQMLKVYLIRATSTNMWICSICTCPLEEVGFGLKMFPLSFTWSRIWETELIERNVSSFNRNKKTKMYIFIHNESKLISWRIKAVENSFSSSKKETKFSACLLLTLNPWWSPSV